MGCSIQSIRLAILLPFFCHAWTACCLHFLMPCDQWEDRLSIKHRIISNGTCPSSHFGFGIYRFLLYADQLGGWMAKERKSKRANMLGLPESLSCLATPETQIAGCSPIVYGAKETHGKDRQSDGMWPKKFISYQFPTLTSASTIGQLFQVPTWRALSWSLLRSVDAASAKREVQEVPNNRKRTTILWASLHHGS